MICFPKIKDTQMEIAMGSLKINFIAEKYLVGGTSFNSCKIIDGPLGQIKIKCNFISYINNF